MQTLSGLFVGNKSISDATILRVVRWDSDNRFKSNSIQYICNSAFDACVHDMRLTSKDWFSLKSPNRIMYSDITLSNTSSSRTISSYSDAIPLDDVITLKFRPFLIYTATTLLSISVIPDNFKLVEIDTLDR